MIQDLINNRYSARKWLDKSIEQEKINYIIDCAYNAPSKQSLYPWTLYVLDESPKCKEFKDWLFWNDTWCYKGQRLAEQGQHSNDKRFNGQYKAPLLLLWAHRNLTNTEEDYSQWIQQRNLIDITVSSSFALLAAEELGLRTCFGKCHSVEYTDTFLDKGTVNVGLALGIGYAEDDDNNDIMLFPVTKDNQVQGYDTKNLNQNYPVYKHSTRKNKPDKNKLVRHLK